MKKVIRLTESDLARIVRRVIREEEELNSNKIRFAVGQEWKVTLSGIGSHLRFKITKVTDGGLYGEGVLLGIFGTFEPEPETKGTRQPRVGDPMSIDLFESPDGPAGRLAGFHISLPKTYADGPGIDGDLDELKKLRG